MQKKRNKFNKKINRYEKRLVRKRQKGIADTLRVQNKIRTTRRNRDEAIASLENHRDNGNWMMQTLGDSPVIFDEALAESSTEQIRRFYDRKGYFGTEVSYSLDTVGRSNKIVETTFLIDEAPPYLISAYEFSSADSAIKSLVIRDTLVSQIKVGQPLDQIKLEQERNRIAKFIKNSGYYGFNKAFILFEVDTSVADKKAEVTLIIKTPPEKPRHELLTIDEVSFHAGVGTRLTDSVNQIKYHFSKTRFYPQSLDKMIYVRPGEPFSLESVEKTQRRLGSLDLFKFVNIQLDTSAGFNRMNIFTDPFKKFQYSLEFGLNVTQSIPGPFTRISLKDRNAFGRLEIMELSLRAAFEAQASATTLETNNLFISGYTSMELGGDVSVTFPRILLPFASNIIRRLKINNPKTEIRAGYSSVNRPEYTRSNIQGVLNYQWNDKSNDRFKVSLLEMQVINTTRKSTAFQQRLIELFNQGNTLIYSFDRSFVTSMSFEFTRAYDYGLNNQRSRYIKGFIEAGGSYLNLLPADLRNNFAGLRTYRFVKSFGEYRQSIPISRESKLVLRSHLGVAIPYGDTESVLPYEKYFFSGGSNSNRAWRPRRVGPGSYTPATTADGSFDYSFEQPGDILFESNIEYRSKFVSFIDWAAFIDASNVWLLRQDASRPGGQISTDAWRELAIGMGLGLRFDFSFLIIRFDWGVRIMDPAMPLGERFLGDDLSFGSLFRRTDRQVLNFGIGYPF